jgi:5-formyltetrahydrofolate cyclo-ligase
MNKKYLRKEYLSKRMLLSIAEQQKKKNEIETQFAKIKLSKIANILSYRAIESKREIVPIGIEKAIINQFPTCRLCYPKIGLAISSMEAIEYEKDMMVTTNMWGVPEPDSNQIIDPKSIDVILVPLLAFDKQGYRVGYGKGFYDRFIARCHPAVITIGLSFFEPVDKIEDVDEYDVPLKYCVTPHMLYSF